jgi:lysophospholipase L1-like esterase
VKRSVSVGILLFLLLNPIHPACALAQAQLRIVVLGSSTAEGCCATTGSGWVDLYRSYLKSIGYPDSTVINLAVGGHTTFKILPTGYVSPYRSVKPLWDIAPSLTNNITKALSLNPTDVIINLPTNDANDLVFPVAYQLDHYTTVIAQASAKGVRVWMCTSQPRNTGSSIRKMLMDMRDSTFNRYGSRAVDFWTTVAADSGTIVPLYDSGDHVHLNNAGHQVLYERIKAKMGINPAFVASPTSLAFGDVALGSSKQLTTTITNQASSTQTFSTIAPGTANYSVTPTSATIASGGSITVTVTYVPKALGLSNDVIAFKYSSGFSVLNFPVTGNSPVPVASVGPTSLDFGDVGKGQNRQVPIRVTNSSINTMTVSSITVGTSVYTVDRASATIGPSQSADIAVKFSPLDVGQYSDTLRLAGNASNFPLRIPITGRSPIPTLSVDPAVVDFGDVRRFVSKSIRLRLRNFSANALDITGFTSNSVVFSTSVQSVRVNASDSADVQVLFSPIAFGFVADTLYIVSNSAFSPQTVPLRGNSSAPLLQLGTQSLIFPQYVVGDTTRLPVKMYNRSANTLTISSLQNKLPHFRLVGSAPSTIGGNDSTSILMAFIPRTGGMWRDTITVVSDGGTARVALQGTSPEQKLFARPDPVSFGNVRVGESLVRWCRIARTYPTEGGTVPIDSAVVRGRKFSIVAMNGPSNLEPSDSLWLALAFQPSEMGNVVDTLLIYVNGSSSVVGVPVSGAGSTFTSVVAGREALPAGYSLNQNYPNPFNPSTTIAFALPVVSHVTLRVFDIVGREVAVLVRGTVAAGVHRVVWDAQEAAGGVYLYRLDATGESLSPGVAPQFSGTRKLVLVK